jgi:hypothetical protein
MIKCPYRTLRSAAFYTLPVILGATFGIVAVIANPLAGAWTMGVVSGLFAATLIFFVALRIHKISRH